MGSLLKERFPAPLKFPASRWTRGSRVVKEVKLIQKELRPFSVSEGEKNKQLSKGNGSCFMDPEHAVECKYEAEPCWALILPYG